MSGPWEDFASTQVATASNSGPWEDFAATGTSKPWEDFSSNAQKLSNTPSLASRFMQGVESGKALVAPLANIPGQIAGKVSDLVGQGLAKLGGMNELPPVTPDGVQGVLHDVSRNINEAAGSDVSRAAAFQKLTKHAPVTGLFQLEKPVIPGIGHIAARGIAETATPANALLAGTTAGMGPEVLKALGIAFGVPMAKQGVEEAVQGDTEGALLHGVGGALMAAAGAVPGKQVEPMLAPGANRYVSGEMMQGTPEMPFTMRNRPGIPMPDRRIPLQIPQQVPSSAIQLPDAVVEPPFQETPPLIGRRPLVVEQQVLPPTEPNIPSSVIVPGAKAVKPGLLPPQLPTGNPPNVPLQQYVKNPEAPGYSPVPYTEFGKREVYTNPIDTPSEPRYSGVPVSDFERYKEVQNLIKVAMAKGDQEGLMKAFAEMEQIKNRQPIRGMPPVEPAKPAATKGSLRPAVEVNGKLLVGDIGDTHADILTRNGIDPELYKHADPARGFTTDGKTLINRQEAAKIAGEEGTAKAGGLDSQDLVQASKSPRQRYLENTAKMSDEEFAQEWKNQSKGVENKPVRASLISGDTVYVGGTVHAETVMMAREAKLPVNLIRHEGRTWMAGDGRTILDESQKPIASQPRRIVWLDKALAKQQLAKEFPNATRSSSDSTHLYSGIPIDKSGKLKDSLKAYWMHFAGHLLPETEDYKLAREVIHDDLTPAKGNLPDEQAKSLEQEMQAKGFTKVIDDGKNIYVDNNASTAQLTGMKNKAKAEGKDLVRMNLYSGINPFDTDNLTKITDKFFGHGVERSFDEGLRHLEAKYHGYSAPHHVAASEDLANKLVRFAAADVYSQVKGLSHEETVAMRDQTFQRLIEAGIRDGVYKYGKAGEASTIDGQPTKAFDVRAKGIGHKSLRVRADLAPEFEMATTRKGKIVKEGAQMMLDLLTEAQIIGPTDFVFHTGNMFSSIIMSEGKTSNYLTDLAMRMPIAKQMDAVGKVGYELYRDIIKDPSVQAEMERIAEIGALRGQSAHSSALGKMTGGILDTGKWIQTIDRAGRRVRNKMYDNLIKQGLAEDTELGRREFINKMGQYNDKLMSHVQAVAKNYTSQFVVAGRTFNRNAMQSILASNEFRAANPTAYAKAKFSNIVSLMASAVALPIVLNLGLNKKPFGRAGTPIGKIDTGKDDANGRPIVIDPMQTDLSRRGFRNLGGEVVVEGLREGREPLDITERAIWAIAMGQLHPWEGPPVRFLEAGIGKKKAGGTAGEAIMEALKAINPTITAALSKTEEGKPGGIGAVAQQLGGAIGVGKGRILSHVERVEKTIDKPITDLSLEDRILAEQRTKSERQPISEEQSTKAAVRAIESEGKRGEALKASFDKPTKQWLDSRQLTVPGYDNKLDFGKTRLYLNPTEEKRLDSLVKEEYQRTIEVFKTDKDAKDFDSLPSLRRQEVFHAAMTQAAKRAHGRMKEELDTKHPSSSNAQNMGKTGRKKRKYHVFGE